MTKKPLRFGGRAAREILIGHRGLTDRVIAAVAATNPAEHGRGEASLAADIRWAVEHNLRAAVDALEGVETDDELMRASAVRRFEEGSTFSSVIAAHHRGVGVLWTELAQSVEDGDGLAEVGERLMRHLERIATVLAEDYQRTALQSHAVERDARFAVFTALTQGGDAAEVAHRFGWALADRYGVLVLRLRETQSGAPSDVSARRVTQRLRGAIDRTGAEDVIAVLGPEGGTALLPLHGRASESQLIVSALEHELQDTFGVGCIAAWSEASIAGVPGAIDVAEELADLAETVPGAPAFVTLDDLVLEFQSARPGPGRDLLAKRLDGVGPDLIATLDAYFRAGGDRRATALALTVHPNTVDYRIGRVTRLTGLDVATPEGAAQLRAALVARRLSGG